MFLFYRASAICICAKYDSAAVRVYFPLQVSHLYGVLAFVIVKILCAAHMFANLNLEVYH